MASPEEFDDDIFDDDVQNLAYTTQPTLPYNGPRVSYNDLKNQISSPPPNTTNGAFVTQPTQIMNTPPAQRFHPPTVQVTGSSPINSSQQPNRHNGYSSPSQYTQQTQPRHTSLAMGMAPRGTYVNVPSIPEASQTPHLPGDDPPVDFGSDDDVNPTLNRANISRTNFKTSGHFAQPQAIPESPATAPRKQFDVSAFGFQGYNSSPKKRPADDSASAYLSRKRVQTGSRQTGPARAQPVVDLEDSPEDDYLTLEDIPDWATRQAVKNILAVVPGKPIGTYVRVLMRCKNNIQDAMARLVEMDDPNPEPVVITSSPPPPPKPLMKRRVENKGSILSKHSRITNNTQTGSSAREAVTVESDQEDELAQPTPATPPKPRRRLLKKKPANFELTALASPEVVTKRKPRQVVNLSEDEDEKPEAAETEDEGFQSEAEPVYFDDRLLKFFNTREAYEIADITHLTIEVANLFIDARPFRSLDAVRQIQTPEQIEAAAAAVAKGKKKSRAKPIGEKVVDLCGDMLTGMEAVDELVKACKDRGDKVTRGLEKWGIDVVGVARGGEVSLTSLDAISSAKDSGIGTPEPSSSSSDKRPSAALLKQPKLMSEDVTLKDYQVLGLNWLNLLWDLKYSCILADDMGLGKTCQVIAFLTHLKESGAEGVHLIVVPGSTLENWLREFKMFSPNLVVEPYYGKKEERTAYQITLEDNRDEIDVVVTTYDMAVTESDNKFLRRYGFSCCVYDEGHLLKNSTSKRYKALTQIKAEHRILLTGTPLQNNLIELASLLAFIMPETFAEHKDDLEFVFKNKTKTSDTNHSSLLSQKRIERARTMLAPFILRRKKQQVLGKHLPAKTSRVEYCELSPSQKKLYDKQMEQQRKVLADRAAGIPNKDRASNMMRLRQAAIHPMLLRQIYTDEKLHKMVKDYCKSSDAVENTDPAMVFDDLWGHSDHGVHNVCVNVYPHSLGKYALKKKEWMDGGKIDALVRLLKDFKKNGDRTLIFSQFTTVLDLLEMVLEEISTPFFRMDGSTPIPQRQDMIDEFYRDTSIPVFMVSTKSGGAGINLACANKVIIFDSSFNPQDDIQAENRAHRVGQTREVEVVRLVTKGTIEEQILRLGQSKVALDMRVAGGEEGGKGADEAELRGMDIVEKMMLGEEVEGLSNEERKEEEGKPLNGKNVESKDGEEKGVEDVKDKFAKMLKKKGVDLAE